MDVWGITLATLRRWYVCLPILAVAVTLALVAGRAASPEYEATATVMLTPPRASSEIANPFINAQGASEAVVVILNGPETAAELEERGFSGDITVSSGSRTSVIVMRSTAADRTGAMGIIDAAIEIGSRELETRQDTAGIPRSSYIGMQVLAAPAITGIANDTAVRVQAVIVALGALGGITLAVLFDDIVGYVRKRRERLQPETIDEDETDAGADWFGVEGGSEETLEAEQVDAEPDPHATSADDGGGESLHEDDWPDGQDGGTADRPSSIEVDEPEAEFLSAKINGEESGADPEYVSSSRPLRGQ